MMPLARLYGPNSKVHIAEQIRYDAVCAALARGVSPLALNDALVDRFFHAQPWISGSAVLFLERMATQ